MARPTGQLTPPPTSSGYGQGIFERFTERGRQVVVFAQDEARALGQSWLGTEHLLLGLIREGGEASIALERAGLTLERARDAVTTLGGVGEEPIVSGQIPFTREARQALEGSLRELSRLQAGEITRALSCSACSG